MGSDRTKNGTFAPGNAGGPGRPRRETERAYLVVIAEACTPDAWHAIVDKAVEDAKAGDAKARDWLASYLVGRPEHAALTLHKLAVQEESGRDSITSDALLESLMTF